MHKLLIGYLAGAFFPFCQLWFLFSSLLPALLWSFLRPLIWSLSVFSLDFLYTLSFRLFLCLPLLVMSFPFWAIVPLCATSLLLTFWSLWVWNATSFAKRPYNFQQKKITLKVGCRQRDNLEIVQGSDFVKGKEKKYIIKSKLLKF